MVLACITWMEMQSWDTYGYAKVPTVWIVLVLRDNAA